MKKVVIFLLLFSLLATVASADVLLELDDDFWQSHMDECQYLYRSYTVNGEEGYAALWESPESNRQRETLANGEQVSGNWLYTADGETWCAVQSGEITGDGYEKIRGWIRLSECIPVPDYISFEQSFGDAFVPYDESYDNAFDGLETFVMWSYPGSGHIVADDMDAEWFADRSLGEQLGAFYLDGEGRYWGYSAYCYGLRNTWICLSDPANTDLPEDPEIREELEKAATVHPAAENVPEPANRMPILVISLVVAVTIVTALLIFFFFRKKKRSA